jgi:hypothetical protein
LSDSVEKAPGGVSLAIFLGGEDFRTGEFIFCQVTAVEAWLALAFEPNETLLRGQGRGRQKTRKLSAKALTYFVKFYWYLFSNLVTIQTEPSRRYPNYFIECNETCAHAKARRVYSSNLP